MFKKFERFFNINDSINNNELRDELLTFRHKFQGKSFGDGLYRVYSEEEIQKWKEIITEGYPDFVNKFEPFGFDWLGRCFAIDLREAAKDKILLFEIGTADVLEIDCNLIAFHNEEIPLHHEACLASAFFEEWKGTKKKILEHNECAGYRIPLFLGGDDIVENLEVSDMEVYWYICSGAKNKK